jgi:hypothetical protein
VLGGVLALVTASACDVDDLRPPADQESVPAQPTGSPAPDSDGALVTTLAAAIADVFVEVGQTRRRIPSLASTLGHLRQMHRAHLGVLGPPERTRTATRVPSSGRQALGLLRRSEERLQRDLASGAIAAQSGALARLLASMSAAVAQHVAALPTEVDGPPS